MDEELLQDFMVEAGELIDGLDGQLIGLEQAPTDTTLLNGVFRAFHTVKGGAGFLGLAPLVDVCHYAEDMLNGARGGRRVLDADAMDAVLGAVDDVRRMFDELRAGQPLQPARAEVLDALKAALDDDGALDGAPAPSGESAHEAAGKPAAEAVGDPGDDPVLRAFEDMLDAQVEAAPASAPAGEGGAPDPDEDEFEALLDSIHQRRAAGEPATALEPAASDPAGSAGDVGTATPAAAPRQVASAGPVSAGAGSATGNARGNGAGNGAGNGNARGNGNGEAAEATLRVGSGRIDAIMNEVGELVLVRNRLTALRGRIADEEINRALSQLNLVTSDLQASVMRLRMQSVGKVFSRFTRVVRDLARQLGKQVELVMQGENTELDKGMVESLADPLVHLVRNAVDHGIEPPAEREAAGKPASGRIVLSARQEGSHIVIEISDDGGGMDAEQIKAKALEKGVLDARTALQMGDEDALQLIFMPGFSTRATVSDVSGRGVGMDVVKSQISRINGSVHLQSEKGAGSRVLIRLPLTLAIMPTLMVVVREQRFALPLAVIEEIVDYDSGQRSTMDGRTVMSLRGEVLPLLDLRLWPAGGDVRSAPDEDRSVVIANAAGRRIGLLVDRLLGQEEVVIKSLGRRLEGLAGFAGATITGDGGIALIVDVGSLYANWSELVPGKGTVAPSEAPDEHEPLHARAEAAGAAAERTGTLTH